MHDEAKRPHEFTGRVVNGQHICRWCAGTPNECSYVFGPYCDKAPPLESTLPPANTEADVERERLARCLESYATGMDRFHRDIADDFRKAASVVRGSALSLTRPAGREEVGPFTLHVVRSEDYSGEHREWTEEVTIPRGHPLISEIAAALTKPPALPKEGEEYEVWRTLAAMLVDVPMYDGADPRALHYQRQRRALEYALSSLPVRSGEVEALNAYRAAVSWIGADAWDGCHDCMDILRAARSLDLTWEWAGDPNRVAQELHIVRTRAALATPQQVKEGEEELAECIAAYEEERRLADAGECTNTWGCKDPDHRGSCGFSSARDGRSPRQQVKEGGRAKD